MTERKSRYVVLTDFGSTYTKVALVDLHEKRLVMKGNYPSTVATDATIGLRQCLDAVQEVIGYEELEKALKLSSSSAAGGLRMGVVGLSPNLSIAAGRNTAFGAGAKILCTVAGKLKKEDVAKITSHPLEILLFCGGYENGSKEVILHNATILAQSDIHLPVIYAGNSAVAQDVRRILTTAHKECYVTDNVIPQVGMFNKEGAENIIRNIFLERIVNMKGLSHVSEILDKMVMPTPAAVLKGGELLSQGTQNQEGLGDLIIVDIGGATTDIHSYADQKNHDGAKIVGSPEPYTKRTVEGDLGMRESSNSLLQEIGIAQASTHTGLNEKDMSDTVNKWLEDHESLASTETEAKLELELSKGAVRISSRRHVGYIERISSSTIKMIQHGKNLEAVKMIIGTGGPLIFSKNPKEILKEALSSPYEEDVLLPNQAECFLDKNYVLYVGGLLREVDEECAFEIMKNSLKEI